ncbi:hypothetical protein [Flavobacterium sp.]|uniref:hypothetical protein n=1 Tax=Flavobacterium sp. TaxID=239 RepID=UPI00286D6A57|nr:hypothetical protein [Flavobacterium sp.]
MKNINLGKSILTLVLIVFFFNPTEMFSQGPPPWAPAHGYRAKTRHIYFPEQNFYYDIQKKNYIYLKNNNWEISVSLPSIFVGINLGNTAQIELDFEGSNPYRYNSVHIVKYKKPKKHKEKYKKEHKHKYKD